MNRARAIRYYYVAAGLLPLLLVLGLVSCDRRKDDRAARVHAAGLRTQAMNYHAAEQLSANWCWAACIQMVFSARGCSIAQPEIVRQALGEVVDAPADLQTLAVNLNRWSFRRDGRDLRFNATIGIGPPPPAVLIQCLAAEIPVIVGAFATDSEVGHAIVVTAVVYEETSAGPVLHSILVRDPSPAYRAAHGKRKLTPEQFTRIEAYFLVTEIAAGR